MKWYPLGLLLLLLGGCAHRGMQGLRPGMPNAEALLPVVAVVDFENRANFSGQWNLGSGFADLLTTALLHSRRAVVLERRDIADVIEELRRQQTELFRPEGRAALQELKNAEYLIRGTVTDFTVTGDSSGWFETARAFVRGRKGVARVAMTVKIADVETGEILASIESSGKASSGGFSAGLRYRDVAFGGSSFFRTPLGQATTQALKDAARKILNALPQKTWDARVAEMHGENGVIVNGGENMGVAAGMRFRVREHPEEVTDPITGNVIERLAGVETGQIEIRSVSEQSSRGLLIEGTARRGSLLEPLPMVRP